VDPAGPAEAATTDDGSAIAFTVRADVQVLEVVAPELARQVIRSLTPIAREQDPMGAYQLEMVVGGFPAAESALDALRRRFQTVGRREQCLDPT
jgi:hypothetical protein